METKRYWLPTIPTTLVEAINRRAAATGSVGYAMDAAHANYNGHHVRVYYNDYRGYWLAEYQWGERVVLTRGNVCDCLRAASDLYKHGAKGCSVTFTPTPQVTEEAMRFAQSLGFVPYSEEAEKAILEDDERKQYISEAFMYERQLGVPAIGILANSTSGADYKEKIAAFLKQRK